MANYYKSCLPAPKPLHAKDVPNHVVNIRRAASEIDKFKKLCDYSEPPEELQTIIDRMLVTQVLDSDLAENANKEQLFEPLSTACRNLVPNGSNHLAVAERKLSRSGETEQDSDNTDHASANPEDAELNEDQTTGDTEGRDQPTPSNERENHNSPSQTACDVSKSSNEETNAQEGSEEAQNSTASDSIVVKCVRTLAKEWLPIGCTWSMNPGGDSRGKTNVGRRCRGRQIWFWRIFQRMRTMKIG